jgi:D-3-phosphoglycerate dehydrogenase
VDLPDLLRQSDVVTLHAATDKRIIGETELSLLKPGSALVNCARGVMVDNEAAWRAVKDGRLWGYGLDEIWNHPELPLEGLNIVVSPHVGADTYSGKDRMQRMSAEAIAAFVESGSPPHVLNPEVLDR